MNILMMSGGMGNQMFQYGLYLSFKKLNTSILIDDYTRYHIHYNFKLNRKPILSEYFHINYPHIRIFRHKLYDKFNVNYYETNLNYDKNVFELNNKIIHGFFQSEKYFIDDDIKKKLKDVFSMPVSHINSSSEFKKLFDQINNNDSVSIHIRRKDYLNKENDLVYGNICTDEYYNSAIKYFEANENRFFIFSDDKEYVMHKYGNQNNTIIVNTENSLSTLDEFYLMSECKHHIIANSSFSWWASYVKENSETITIAPKKWINTYDLTDIYRDNMIKI